MSVPLNTQGRHPPDSTAITAANTVRLPNKLEHNQNNNWVRRGLTLAATVLLDV
jgi:hypothetical protein